MATETLYPDAILEQTGITGSVSDVNSAPDGTWTAADGTNTSIFRLSFPSPSGNPGTGAGLQTFHVYARKNATGGGDPSIDSIELYEDNVLRQTLTPSVSTVTSATGQDVTATWSASNLTSPDGSGVEIRIVSSKGGGGPNQRNIEYDSISWTVTIGAPVVDSGTISGSGTGAGSGTGTLPVWATWLFDSFTEASDTPLENHAPDQKLSASSTWGSFSENTQVTVYSATGAAPEVAESEQMCLWPDILPAADVRATLSVDFNGDTLAADRLGIMLRADNTATSVATINGYQARLDANGSCRIVEYTSGTSNILDSGTLTIVGGVAEIEFSVIGSTVKAIFRSGENTTTFTQTDTTHTAAGYARPWFYGLTNAYWDSFTVEILAIPSGTVTGTGAGTGSATATTFNPDAPNLLAYSEDFSGQWSLNGVTITPGQSDPDGGTDASNMDTGGVEAYPNMALTTAGPFQSETLVFSVYAKNIDSPKTLLYVEGTTTTDNPYCEWTWSAGVPSFSSVKDEPNITVADHGEIDVGGGWYRLWATFQVGATSEASLESRVYNAYNDTTAGYTATYWGAQLEQNSAISSYKPTGTGSGTVSSGTVSGAGAGAGSSASLLLIGATASATGAGLGSASPLLIIPGTATGAGTGSATAAGASVVSESASGVGAGQGSVDAINVALGDATGNGAGTGASTGLLTTFGVSSSPGVGFGSSSAILIVLASATGVGAGTGVSSVAAIVTGTATGAGSGLGTSDALSQALGSASGSGEGLGTSQALLEVLGASTGSGEGLGSAASLVTIPSSATGAGAGTGAADSLVTTFATATGSGTGAGTASTDGLVSASATGSGQGSGTAVGLSQALGAATGLGEGSGTGQALLEVLGASSGTGEGTGSASGYALAVATASGSGVGAGTADSTVETYATATGTGVGSGTATGASAGINSATGVGTGSGTASATLVRLASATATGVGTGSASALVTVFASATGAGAGAGTATSGSFSTVSSGAVSGTGIGSGTGDALSLVHASASGAGVGSGQSTGVAVRVATATGTGSGLGSSSASVTVLASATGSGTGAGSATPAASTITGAATGVGTGSGTAVGSVRPLIDPETPTVVMQARERGPGMKAESRPGDRSARVRSGSMKVW